jgi:hypothetical protein
MGIMDQNSEIDVMTERASEPKGYQIVEWNIRPSAASANPDAEIDNGCGCGCGCD